MKIWYNIAWKSEVFGELSRYLWNIFMKLLGSDVADFFPLYVQDNIELWVEIYFFLIFVSLLLVSDGQL